MRRLIANSVFCGFVTAWRFAGWPTSTSPSLVNAMTEGVVRSPSLFSITRGFPPSMMATQEFVVPRSMPITLAIGLLRKKAFCVRLAALVGCLPLPIQVEAIAKKREFGPLEAATSDPGRSGARLGDDHAGGPQ